MEERIRSLEDRVINLEHLVTLLMNAHPKLANQERERELLLAEIKYQAQVLPEFEENGSTDVK